MKATHLFAVLGVVAAAGLGCQPPPQPEDPRAKLLSADAKDLSATLVTANPREAITAGTNLVWCGTFQLAWNELLNTIGLPSGWPTTPSPEVSSSTALVQGLNERLVTRSDLDEASYVALAGTLGSGIVDAITSTMHQKFSEVTPNIPPAGSDPRTIIAYAYLLKNLLFPVPFETEDPISFKGQDVLCFGASPSSSSDIVQQVTVLDYKSSDDFVIELQTRSEADQLILAKVSPQATLEETIQDVQGRHGGPPEMTGSEIVLRVPMMNLDIFRSFEELIGYTLPGPDQYTIGVAQQSIRFELNEAGVRLESEAGIVAQPSAPPPPLKLIFDKPFLLMMKLRAVQHPYFAMWIDNAELLGKANE